MINLKTTLKLASVMILAFTVVFILSIFINYAIDLKGIESLLNDSKAQSFYDALTVQTNISIAASGSIVGAITLIVLLFSIGQFINEHSAELGVLKALGYSENRLALDFMKFGISVFIGAVIGFCLSMTVAQVFYNAFDQAVNLGMVVKYKFHIETPLIMIVAPTVLFSLFAFTYARLRLRKKSLELIHGDSKTNVGKLTKRLQAKENSRPFLRELQINMLFNNMILIFFVGFAALSFSAGMQMAFMMSDVTEGWLTPTVFVMLAIILGAVTLLLALTFVVKKNVKYLAMLKAYGYTEAECYRSMFGGYRIVTYIGFAIGTLYQYFVMKAMVGFFTSDYGAIALNFNVVGFFVTLAAFLITYELIMIFYRRRIAKISLKEIMQ